MGADQLGRGEGTGGEQCIALHASDLCVPLVALDAVVRVRSAAGERRVPLRELYVLPGDRPDIENVLAHGELITAIEIPLLRASSRTRYLKVRDRASYAFALASAAVAVDLDGRTIRDARVGLGGIATKPWRSTEAEHLLIGKPATEQTFRAAADAALANARPHPGNGFKVLLAKRTLVRALTEVTA